MKLLVLNILFLGALLLNSCSGMGSYNSVNGTTWVGKKEYSSSAAGYLLYQETTTTYKFSSSTCTVSSLVESYKNGSFWYDNESSSTWYYDETDYPTVVMVKSDGSSARTITIDGDYFIYSSVTYNRK